MACQSLVPPPMGSLGRPGLVIVTPRVPGWLAMRMSRTSPSSAGSGPRGGVVTVTAALPPSAFCAAPKRSPPTEIVALPVFAAGATAKRPSTGRSTVRPVFDAPARSPTSTVSGPASAAPGATVSAAASAAAPATLLKALGAATARLFCEGNCNALIATMQETREMVRAIGGLRNTTSSPKLADKIVGSGDVELF